MPAPPFISPLFLSFPLSIPLVVNFFFVIGCASVACDTVVSAASATTAAAAEEEGGGSLIQQLKTDVPS